MLCVKCKLKKILKENPSSHSGTLAAPHVLSQAACVMGIDRISIVLSPLCTVGLGRCSCRRDPFASLSTLDSSSIFVSLTHALKSSLYAWSRRSYWSDNGWSKVDLGAGWKFLGQIQLRQISALIEEEVRSQFYYKNKVLVVRADYSEGSITSYAYNFVVQAGGGAPKKWCGSHSGSCFTTTPPSRLTFTINGRIDQGWTSLVSFSSMSIIDPKISVCYFIRISVCYSDHDSYRDLTIVLDLIEWFLFNDLRIMRDTLIHIYIDE